VTGPPGPADPDRPDPPRPKRPQGFAALPPEQRRAIARQGGLTAQAAGNAHRWTPEQARIAGRKGGQAKTRQRELEREREQARTARTPEDPHE
jgi:general stress protein YciG